MVATPTRTKKKPGRKCVLVLGMHRSGTSALTKTLASLGLQLPKTMLGANQANQDGHWESERLIQANDELLADLGSFWDDWRSLDLSQISEPELETHREKISSIIMEEFQGSDTFVLKEPRICRMAGFYSGILASLGVETVNIHINRNPLEVARSLSTRNLFSTDYGLLLWLRHVSDCERATRANKRVFLNYNSLFENTIEQVVMALKQLGIDVDAEGGNIGNGTKPMKTELRHHHVSEDELNAVPPAFAPISKAYQALRALENNPNLKRAERQLDKITKSCLSSGSFLEIALEEEFVSRSNRLAKYREQKVAVRVQEDERRILAEEQKTEDRDELVNLTARLKGDLESLERKEREERRKAAAERKDTISLMADLQASLSEMEKEVDHYRQFSEELLSSTSWRVTAPLRGAKDLVRGFRRGNPDAADNPVGGTRSRLKENAKKALRVYRTEGVTGVGRRIANLRRQSSVSRSPEGRDVPISRSRLLGTGTHEYIDQVLDTAGARKGISSEYVPKTTQPFDLSQSPIKTIAFYLPQFHPIPENDEWWGKGFTEWTNVSKAVPQFVGHYQPRLPGELGFYDLRVVDIQRQQAEMAKHYGIYGFCYHHYWFGGKRLLERPVNQILANPDIDLPFCLCWANENWSRRWDGMDHDVLMAQNHSPEDDLEFIKDIAPALRDPRYIRFNGKPVLIVYRASLLPNAKATASRWRDFCRKEGIGDLYLVAARSFGIKQAKPFGFDATLEFPPHEANAGLLNDQIEIVNPDFEGSVFSYHDLAQSYGQLTAGDAPLIKTVSPGWDNAARKPGKGHTFLGASPAAFAAWFRKACEYTNDAVAMNPEQPPFVFINAWNEWAEGAHLEPDRKFGYASLHAVANVLQSISPLDERIQKEISASQDAFKKTSDGAVILHLYYADLIDEIGKYLSNAKDLDLFVSLGPNMTLSDVQTLRERYPNAYLLALPNRGRDMSPFLQMLQLMKREQYDYFCKIHTKKSPQRKDGETLRQQALDELMGSPQKVQNFINNLKGQTRVGILAPASSILDLAEPDRNVLNRAWLDELLTRMGQTRIIGVYDWNFVAGSMFWARTAAVEPILKLGLKPEDFEEELGQVDGTLAHSIERIIGLACSASGYEIQPIN